MCFPFRHQFGARALRTFDANVKKCEESGTQIALRNVERAISVAAQLALAEFD